MLNSKTFVSILILIWIAGSSYWWTCLVRKQCGPDWQNPAKWKEAVLSYLPSEIDLPERSIPEESPSSPIHSWFIYFGEEKVLSSRESIRFAKKDTVGFLSKEVHKSMEDLVLWLQTNPGTGVVITGLYSEAEKDTLEVKDVGILRANFVARTLFEIGLDSTLAATQSQTYLGNDFWSYGDSTHKAISLYIETFY
ncbi:MAG: hypothetical protein AAF388_23665 [Bacteroidota bacterium]